jgi:putative hemolysin
MVNKLVDSTLLFKPAWRPFYRPLQGAVEATLGLDGINQVYEDCKGGDTDAFAEKVLRRLGLSWDFPDSEIQRLRAIQGPLMVTANHPFGMAEAILMMLLLNRIRGDYRVMSNFIVGLIPEVKPRLIMVDPFEGKGAAARNLGPLRQALKWLASGGALGIFPAGEVSALRAGAAKVSDRPWQAQTGKLALMSGATVLPLFFEGQNSAAFQAAGLISPWLRTLMLPRAVLKPAYKDLKFRFGQPIAPARIAELGSPEKVSRYLRERCYLLAEPKRPRRAAPLQAEPLAGAEAVADLESEIAQLKAQGRLLLSQGPYEALTFKAAEAPALMRETGRLRERSFREAGEGTGKARDLDAYDPSYLQLLLWDSGARRLVGAYRMADAGALIRGQGPEGLYCHSLFKLKAPLLAELGDALELGRSFVASEYQRDHLPLLLLWRGIGAWLAQNPRFTRLFGCVSISPDFSPLTQQLLVSFIRQSSFDALRSAWVMPRLAFKLDRRFEALVARALELQSMRQLQELVDEIEQGRLKLPTLLRHYLKLGGRILAFNVDPDFNHTLDGLFMVELPKSPPKILEKYMGAAEAKAYLSHHRF